MSLFEQRAFNLSIARNEEEIGLSGKCLQVIELPAGLDVKVRFVGDGLISEPISLLEGRIFNLEFSKFYLTNLSQSGTLSIFVSDDPDISVEDTDIPKTTAASTDATASLISDKNGTPIQGALEPKISNSLALSITSNRSVNNFVNKILKIYSTVDCFYRLGDSTVTASQSDHFLPAKAIEYIAVGNNTKIAACVTTGTGVLYTSEMG